MLALAGDIPIELRIKKNVVKVSVTMMDIHLSQYVSLSYLSALCLFVCLFESLLFERMLAVLLLLRT